LFVQAPKKADKIEITSETLSDWDLFSEAVIQLKEDGFTWSEIDKDFYIVKTDAVNQKYFGLDLYLVLNVSVTGNKITITGKSPGRFEG